MRDTPIPASVLCDLIGPGEVGGKILTIDETPGEQGVLLTAAHAARHLHPSKPFAVRGADVGTGEVVHDAAYLTGAWALSVRAPWPGNANAGPVEHCVFKQRVISLLESGKARAVLDVHGMSDRYGIDVCVGSGGAQASVAVTVAEVFRSHGLRVKIDEPFSGARRGTVTRSCVEAGFVAVQLELASCVRRFERDTVLAALADSVRLLSGLRAQR